MNNLFVYTFYRFKKLENICRYKNTFDKYLLNKDIKGTILIANEGINGSISGSKSSLEEFIKFIRSYLNIRKIDLKINKTEFFPFNKMKVRLKKEIVSLGKGEFDTNKFHGKSIKPEYWNNIISDKNTKIIDVRNRFEIEIGRFTGSINPKTKSFRGFPKAFKEMKIKKEDTIAMYCTGGIRCEKASAYLKVNGYKNILQLSGGIINYLEHVKNNKINSMWKGECFVFDQRVTINNLLVKGKYSQCYGCRSPITKKEMKSKYYRKGISCPKCFFERTTEQKKRSNDRQKQIDQNISLKRAK